MHQARQGTNWIVQNIWEGQTAVIFASGPSLTKNQIDIVRSKQCKTIAINRTIASAPWVDVHYFCDYKFYNWMKFSPDYDDVRAAYSSFNGIAVTIAQQETHAKKLLRGHQFGLSENPEYLCTGGNSGYQAINLAFLLGAKTIILLGYDQQAVNGRCHHHKNHPGPTSPTIYDSMIHSWQYLEKDIRGKAKVLNCTPNSRIDCFDKIDLIEALNGIPESNR